MATITKVLRMVNKGAAATVYVQLDDGSEAEIFIGGAVEIWFDHAHNKSKAHVRRAQSRGKL